MWAKVPSKYRSCVSEDLGAVVCNVKLNGTIPNGNNCSPGLGFPGIERVPTAKGDESNSPLHTTKPHQLSHKTDQKLAGATVYSLAGDSPYCTVQLLTGFMYNRHESITRIHPHPQIQDATHSGGTFCGHWCIKSWKM